MNSKAERIDFRQALADLIVDVVDHREALQGKRRGIIKLQSVDAVG